MMSCGIVYKAPTTQCTVAEGVDKNPLAIQTNSSKVKLFRKLLSKYDLKYFKA